MLIVTGVGDLVYRTEDSQTQVRYSVTKRLRYRVMLCAICTVHEETMSVDFLVKPQNRCRRFFPIWPQN
jgi:hypothetical protein